MIRNFQIKFRYHLAKQDDYYTAIPQGGIADSDENPPSRFYSREGALGVKSFFIWDLPEGGILANRFPKWA